LILEEEDEDDDEVKDMDEDALDDELALPVSLIGNNDYDLVYEFNFNYYNILVLFEFNFNYYNILVLFIQSASMKLSTT
jgi:hypothetical protein